MRGFFNNGFIGTASLGALAIAALAGPAFAQSTGSVDFEQKEIVVTGTSVNKGVDGVVVPEGAKSRGVLNQQFIAKQRAGQSVDDLINMLPGVSFQNNDPYGTSGGTLTIRGFDSSRISQTFDGVPLNDTGNYALYSQQQLDSELIEQVNVNLGTTDVDSPTAAASGSTVNYRTRNPTEDFHARVEGSAGEFGYYRIFGVIDSGAFGPFGTRMFVAASSSENRNPYQQKSKAKRQQYNVKLYQPIGVSGDFVSVAGHYNIGRNGNFSSIPLRTDTAQSALNAAARVVGEASTNRFPLSMGEANYTYPGCTTAAATAGKADTPNTCGTVYGYSFNPGNTANIRINSKFTLADGLVLTVDPSFQYVKANGGTGAVKANEGFYSRAASGSTAAILTPLIGYIGGNAYFGGVDLNGDGDVLDSSTRNATTGALSNTAQGVELYAPSQTVTHRYGVIASLRYDIATGQTVRLNYSHDYGRHRQTGEIAKLNLNGYTTQFFPIDNPLKDANGNIIEKRNRKSFAILDQVSGEYRGEFFDSKLVVNAGVRAPFFKRDLNNYCVTETGGSFVDCFNGEPASQAAFLAANPTYVAPTHKVFKFNRILPTGGFSYNLDARMSVYGSYTKGLQVPGTDNLYQSLGFSADQAVPRPETTDNFDLGWRYRSSKIQAQLAGWYTVFKNRLASSYDPTLDVTVYRNLGTVHKYGVDANIAYTPVQGATLYVFGSYLKSKILQNVQSGICNAAQVTAGSSTGTGTCTAAGQPIYALTQGKREAGAPVYTFGGRAEANWGPLEVGIQAKRTGARYVNDQNLPIYQCASTTSANSLNNGTCIAPNVLYQVYGAKARGYTLVDLDARVDLSFLGLNKDTYLQVNATNIFNKLYVSGFTGNTAATAIPFSYIGPPSAISGTINFAF